MKVSVIGAGAIGGWLTSGFVKGGAQATVLARGASLEALRSGALKLETDEGIENIPVTATADPQDLCGADVLLLGVKAHDLPGLAPVIEKIVTPGTQVMPAVNGLPFWYFEGFGGPASGLTLQSVDPAGQLAARMPVGNIVGNVVHTSSHVAAPGHIRVVKAFRLLLGGKAPRLDEIAQCLAAGGLPVVMTDDIHREIWAKLWGNSNLNPMSALTRADSGQMLDDPGTRGMIATMMREMSELGTLIGLTGFDNIEERLDTTRRLGTFRTSMLQDVEAGRPIELGPILGCLVELAAHLGHPVPVLTGIHGLVGLLDRNLRGC